MGVSKIVGPSQAQGGVVSGGRDVKGCRDVPGAVSVRCRSVSGGADAILRCLDVMGVPCA